MYCPKCQFENTDGAKFCNECGNSLIPKPQVNTAVPIIESERKRITALFSDLSGYTAMTEQLDPEEVKEITSRIFDGATAIIKRYDGFIERFAGDGFLALFGVPRAHGDDPIRAIQAAREVHQFVEKGLSPWYEIKVGRSLSMHSGINTGLAITAGVDPEKGTQGATGMAINIAARLSDLASDREILVGPDTYRASRAHFAFKPLKAAKVKGKLEPVPIFKVISKEALASRMGTDRQVFSEMIGRDQDLEKLELQVMKLVNGEGSIVNIIGEAGIGKSRLIAELKQQDLMKKVTLLEGKTVSIGRNLSFHLVIDLLKHWARIGKDDEERRAFDKLETAVRNVHPKEMHEVVPFVAVLMGMKLPERYGERLKGIEGEALEKLIQKNVRALLTKAAELTPLVLVAEDLHWADTSSIELLESLFRLTETQRILFVNLFRPAYRKTGDHILEIVKEKFPENNCEIVLEPLDERTSEALINNMLHIGGPHHPVTDQIVKRAGGNPFFIEEVVRSLIDEGAIVLKDGLFQVTDKMDTIIVPHTINDVLMARIDRLEEKTRNLVKVASVIGRTFFYRIVSDVAVDVKDIDKRLGYLKETQLIRERTRMDEIEYLFKHALAQEVAYESILLHKRKELHLQVADSIESVFEERLHEFYGMLAFHYSMGEDEEKAAVYLIKAGEEALKSSASSEAINYYQEGLRLYLKKHGGDSDPVRLALLEKNIALAFFNKGQHIHALEYFDSALERWGVKSSRNKIVAAFGFLRDILSLIANLYLPSKKTKMTPDKHDNEFFDLHYKRAILLVYVDPKRSFVEFVKGLRILNKFNITEIENGVGMWMSSSLIFSWAGISHKISKKALEYAKDLINKDDVKEILYYEFFDLLHKFFTGNWHHVKIYDRTLVDLNLRIGEFWLASTYIVFHGFIKIDQGLFREAEALIDKLSEIWEDYRNQDAREYQCSLKIKLLMESRKLKDALFEANAGIAFQKENERELAILYYFGFKSIIQIFLERIDSAEESLSQADELISRIDAVAPLYIGTSLIGRFLYDLRRLEQAFLFNDHSEIAKYQKHARKSGKRALKNSTKYRADRTEVLRLMGIYCWLTGKQDMAVKWWRSSIEEGERLGAKIGLARTCMEIGRRFLEEKSNYHELNNTTAEEYLEKARVLFEEMDLQWDLNEVDRIAV